MIQQRQSGFDLLYEYETVQLNQGAFSRQFNLQALIVQPFMSRSTEPALTTWVLYEETDFLSPDHGG